MNEVSRPIQIILLLGALVYVGTLWADNPNQESFWYGETVEGQPIVHLHFFWSSTCPHCQEALPFMETLPKKLPWLRIHDYPITGKPENLERYIDFARTMALERISVPGFMFCERLETGFRDSETTGVYLLEELRACYQQRVDLLRLKQEAASPTAELDTSLEKQALSAILEDKNPARSAPLPLVGSIDTQRWSLPMLTLVLAGLDAFNPCAFFVLLFLLSLLTHAHNRARMLVVGGVFVFFSGLIYFAFMAAWLNVFIYSGELRIVTVVAALLAIFVGLLNSKDFFWFKRGPSLSISETAKPNIFRRMRQVIEAGSMGAMLTSTVVLAIVANSYELLCTAGFPMVYTRALTMQELGTFSYYLYLIAYNIIYVIPLAVIVLAFTYTLGARKLSEFGGRVLKLVSGYMMLALGLLLLLSPESLSNAWVSLLILILVLGTAGLTVIVQRRFA